MNDLHQHCEPWFESISLAAAGCLSPSEERDVCQHIEVCADCRERFEQLTELCGSLADASLANASHADSRQVGESAETAFVQRVMATVESDETRRSDVQKRMRMIQPRFFFPSFEKLRRIMISPVSRISTAVVAALLVTGVALWMHGGASPAFADFIAPILDAKSAKFKIVTEVHGPSEMTMTGQVLVLGGNRSRHEMTMQMPIPFQTPKQQESKMVMIYDWAQGKSLSLDSASKRAFVASLDNLTDEQIANQDMFAAFRSMLLDARSKPDVEREALGGMILNGRSVVGFRVSGKGMVVSIWGDPKTGLPVSVEMRSAMSPNTKTTMSDFVFNVDLDESLFSVAPPSGYAVQNMNVDVSQPEEQDLIATFREYHELSGGVFPDSLDLQEISQVVGEKLAAGLLQQQSSGENPEVQVEETMDERTMKFTKSHLRLQRGLLFALVVLPRNADAHYAGKGVSFGAAEQAIFWYRPQDSHEYRVIFGDLTVRNADTPPKVARAQPLSGMLHAQD